MKQLKIREVHLDDLDRCFDIESVSYAGDEAASREKIHTRIETYPQGFIVIEIDGEVVGFINSGATHKVELSDEEFKELVGHDPSGPYIVIMSVVVHPDFQGRGLAGQLLKTFIEKMRAMNKQEIHLICQSELIGLYSKYGFQLLGESGSDHGGLSWYEMSLGLTE